MKYRWPLFHKIILVVLVMQCGSINRCSGLDLEIDTRLAELEILWSEGNVNQFYLETEILANDIIMQGAHHDIDSVATMLLESLLSKNLNGRVADLGLKDLKIKEMLAKQVLSNNNVSVEQRRANTLILSLFLGRIRTESIPNYRPLHVSANVSPPLTDGQFGMAGMNPEAVADPVAKAKYVEAIKRNRQNDIINRRQIALGKLDNRISQPIIDFIKETLNVDISSHDLANEFYNNARLSIKEAEQIEKLRVENQTGDRVGIGRVKE